MIPTYISTPSPIKSKPSYVIYFEYCHQIKPTPLLCELPDELAKRGKLPDLLSNNSITASGTVSGVSTSTIQLGMQYEVKAEK